LLTLALSFPAGRSQNAHKSSGYRLETASTFKPCTCPDCQSSAHRTSLRRQNAVSIRRRQLTDDAPAGSSSFGDDGTSAGPSSSTRLSGLPAPSADNTLAALLSRHVARAGRTDPNRRNPIEYPSDGVSSDSDDETIYDFRSRPAGEDEDLFRRSVALAELRARAADRQANPPAAAPENSVYPPHDRTPYSSPTLSAALDGIRPPTTFSAPTQRANFSPVSRSPTLYSPSAAEADADGWISVGSRPLRQTTRLGLASPPPSSAASGSRIQNSFRPSTGRSTAMPSLADIYAAASAEEARIATHLLEHGPSRQPDPPLAATPDWEALQEGLTAEFARIEDAAQALFDVNGDADATAELREMLESNQTALREMLDAGATRRRSARRRADEEGVWADEPERRRTPAAAAVAAATSLGPDADAGTVAAVVQGEVAQAMEQRSARRALLRPGSSSNLAALAGPPGPFAAVDSGSSAP
jgi:hypothetical protein